MSDDIPAEEQLKEIMKEHGDIREKIEQTESEEEKTAKLTEAIVSEISGGDKQLSKEEGKELREMIKESEQEVSEIYRELEEERDIEEKEKDVADLYKNLVEDTSKKDEQEEKILEAAEGSLEALSENFSREGLNEVAGEVKEAGKGIVSISREEIAGAEGLEKLSEEIMETAEEEEELLKEIEEEKEISREGDEVFKAMSSKKGDKAEKRLRSKEDKEEQEAINELEEAESLTELDEEEIRTLYNNVKRSRKMAEELYNDLEELIELIKRGGRIDSMDSSVYGNPDQPSSLNQEEKDEYIESLREEREALQEAAEKMNKAIRVLEKANEIAKKSEEVEQEAEGAV